MSVPALEDTIILHSPLNLFIFMNKPHLCSHITHHSTMLYTVLNFFKILVYCFSGWKLHLQIQTFHAVNHFLLSSKACWFLLVTSIHLRSSHNEFTVAGNIPMGYFFAEKDLKLKAQTWKKNMNANVPGSKGHSLSLANSAGVFPVRTQLELRSIIGILQENQAHFYFRFR